MVTGASELGEPPSPRPHPFSGMLHSLPVGICVLEWRDGLPVLMWWNDELGRLFQEPLEVGMPVLPLLKRVGARHPAQGALRHPHALRHFLGGRPMRLEELLWVQARDGDRAVRLTIVPLEWEEALRLMFVMEDVTEFTLSQRSVDAFVAATGHELRTPLTSLRAVAELLRMGVGELGEEQLAEGLDRLLAEADELARILEELVDLTRIRLGLYQSEMGPVDLAEVARTVAGTCPVSLELDLDEDADHVITDRRMLERALRLLLENAVRHGAPPFRLETELVGGTLEIRVVDHGPGLPEEERELLFLPFVKDLARLGTGEGSGLGLALVRGLASGMGASLRYRDRPAGGSSVAVVFGREY